MALQEQRLASVKKQQVRESSEAARMQQVDIPAGFHEHVIVSFWCIKCTSMQVSLGQGLDLFCSMFLGKFVS